jgi:hypothetical protein
MGGVGAGDPAATSISPADRIEVHEGITSRRQAAAARCTRDRAVAAVANG